MTGFKALIVLSAAVLAITGCAVPLGEDYLITRDGSTGIIYISDYNLQTYVPIPKTGEKPVTIVNNREDLELTVEWKDAAGAEAALPFERFEGDTVYQAEIKLTPKSGYGFFPSTPFAYPGGKITDQRDDLGEPIRTVTVTYNNSDDADITFIIDYNLQSYVPMPLAGEKPTVTSRADVTVEVVWNVKGSPNPISTNETFEAGEVYQATISLTANQGYRFIAAWDFKYPPETVTTQPDNNDEPNARNLSTVTYMVTRKATVISDLNLTPYLPKPVSGTMPVSSFAGSQYTGKVSWKDTETQVILTAPFQFGTGYTAEVTLTPALGYTFTGVGQNTFIHTGAGPVSNPANSGTVSITFSSTGSAGGAMVVYDTVLTGHITKPVSGVTPVSGIAGSQYNGTVAWTPAHRTFQYGTVYTAELTLHAASGYTFTGIGQNVFTHRDAIPGGVTNQAGSSRVRIIFAPAVSSANPATTFGPVETEGSALWLMKENRDYIYPLFIALSKGPSEHISAGTILMAGDNSPANVIIDGNNQVLTIQPGVIITVGVDVTVTLQNITFKGPDGGNISPLFKVWRGGKLILGEGAVLSDNLTTGDVGGVWVNGGSLILNEGAKIKNMEAPQGGGVLIDINGKFVMNGGIIGGEVPGDGNTVSGVNAGGGVLVVQGSFDMYGGAIQYNKADNERSGGGVGVLAGGTFNLNAGTIKENTAQTVHSGGGVYLYGTTGRFAINGAAAAVENNHAESAGSGGGVYNDGGGFTMNSGLIRGNTAEAGGSGGGVFGGLLMNGGIIQTNLAYGADSGGGVYVYGGYLDMYGGIIKGNRAFAVNSGGGVYNTSRLEMFGAAAIIAENIAEETDSGGGVYDRGSLLLLNGFIKDNEAKKKQSGGGLYIDAGGGGQLESTENGVAIQGNKATNSTGGPDDAGSGGAVFVNGGSLQVLNGIIGGALPEEANIAAIGANGVYIAGGTFHLGYQSSYGSGIIKGNTQNDTTNYGVYVKSTDFNAFSLSGSGRVTPDNKVFLAPGATITISYGGLSGSPPAAAIICDSPVSWKNNADTSQATKLLSSFYSYSTYINSYKNYFTCNGSPILNTHVVQLPDTNYYGYYNE
ncbi:MAG: hypothetical protein LBC60_09865 [Spirochaetaceae bacterium]|jgi:hypothetical protein|nr:hypothetical protein [Spirochaetaceae bacterium]